MITGIVDEFGRALIPLLIQAAPNTTPVELRVWIDTGFTGDLVLSRSTIDQLGLTKVSNVDARLADGTISSYDVFYGWTNWMGKSRKIEVIEGGSSIPLLGTLLLSGFRLTVDYAVLQVKIDRPV